MLVYGQTKSTLEHLHCPPRKYAAGIFCLIPCSDTYEIVILFVFSLVTMVNIWIVTKPHKPGDKLVRKKDNIIYNTRQVPQDRHPARLDPVLRDRARIRQSSNEFQSRLRNRVGGLRFIANCKYDGKKGSEREYPVSNILIKVKTECCNTCNKPPVKWEKSTLRRQIWLEKRTKQG